MVEQHSVLEKTSVKASVYAGLVLAVLLAVIGAGVSTRDIARDNTQEIQRIIEAGRQIKVEVRDIRKDISMHDDLSAHREAALQLRRIETMLVHCAKESKPEDGL